MPRTSDGISLLREVERTFSLVRVCGQIWEISQTRHTFWLDVERVGQELHWTLYFDPCELRSPRVDSQCLPGGRPQPNSFPISPG
jgi:hypothetical protein